MSTDILEKDLTSLFGIDAMPPKERDEFLEDIGSLVMESTITRLMIDMSEDEQEKVVEVVTESESPENILENLEKAYPQINQLFREEVTAFKEEAIAVMSEE